MPQIPSSGTEVIISFYWCNLITVHPWCFCLGNTSNSHWDEDRAGLFSSLKNMVGVLFCNLKNLLKKWVTNNARQSLKEIKFRFFPCLIQLNGYHWWNEMDNIRIISCQSAEKFLLSLEERRGDLAPEISMWPPEIKRPADISLETTLQWPSQLK